MDHITPHRRLLAKAEALVLWYLCLEMGPLGGDWVRGGYGGAHPLLLSLPLCHIETQGEVSSLRVRSRTLTRAQPGDS